MGQLNLEDPLTMEDQEHARRTEKICYQLGLTFEKGPIFTAVNKCELTEDSVKHILDVSSCIWKVPPSEDQEESLDGSF